MKKIALIFGITGQDGSYLAELLLKKLYSPWCKRRSSSINTSRVDHIYQDPHEKNYNFRLHYGDITDHFQFQELFKKLNQMKFIILLLNLTLQFLLRYQNIQPMPMHWVL